MGGDVSLREKQIVKRRRFDCRNPARIPHHAHIRRFEVPREFGKGTLAVVPDNKAVVDQVNRRMGYRLQLREMSWPATVTIGKPFEVRSTWANAGVAPCYPGGFVTLTLKDEKGGIVSVLVDEGLDSGPIVMQEAVAVRAGDSEATLSARILEAEHRIYPRAVRALLEGRCAVAGRRVLVEGE